MENQKKEIIQEYEKKLQLVDTRISLIRLISLTNLSKLLTIGFFLITMGPSYLFMIFLAFYTQVNFFIFSALLGLYPTFLIYREISESARINSPNYLRLISERDKKLKDITFLQSNTR